MLSVTSRFLNYPLFIKEIKRTWHKDNNFLMIFGTFLETTMQHKNYWHFWACISRYWYLIFWLLWKSRGGVNMNFSNFAKLCLSYLISCLVWYDRIKIDEISNTSQKGYCNSKTLVVRQGDMSVLSIWQLFGRCYCYLSIQCWVAQQQYCDNTCNVIENFASATLICDKPNGITVL